MVDNALYNPHQSGREWNEELDVVLKNIGHTGTQTEPCLYLRLYDDDVIEATNCKSSHDALFELGSISMTRNLGIELQQRKDEIYTPDK
ncbi:hypothetical protein CCR75_000900 [Bremia lactucae]|uniref:Uncharacterized protein n=1 Tax=Bremia lactucae TaxID=4779 RepID=A0A976FM40_BRELC|nr:hypothetical protein CCR75_000900 [Bremia lactucae]